MGHLDRYGEIIDDDESAVMIRFPSERRHCTRPAASSRERLALRRLAQTVHCEACAAPAGQPCTRSSLTGPVPCALMDHAVRLREARQRATRVEHAAALL